MIDNLSQESIKRLHKLNAFRDFLHLQTESLADIRVLKVEAFGSTINGLANSESDVDIVFYIQGDPRLNLNQQTIKNTFLQLILPILQRFGLTLLTEIDPEKIDLHFHLVYIDNPLAQANYARDFIPLWK